jgi:hypothetical protein
MLLNPRTGKIFCENTHTISPYGIIRCGVWNCVYKPDSNYATGEKKKGEFFLREIEVAEDNMMVYRTINAKIAAHKVELRRWRELIEGSDRVRYPDRYSWTYRQYLQEDSDFWKSMSDEFGVTVNNSSEARLAALGVEFTSGEFV